MFDAPWVSATELINLSGLDVEANAAMQIIDGGPYLNERYIESLGEGEYIPCAGRLRFRDPEGFTSKVRRHQDQAAEEIISLVGKVSGGVNMPLGGLLPQASYPSSRG